MIDVIYNKEENIKKDNPKTSDKEPKLPKNIRQIGNPGSNKKIYIEDYVVTYLAGLALPSNSYSRGAILLGEVKKGAFGPVVFINGALEAQNLELDLDETVFTNETWAGIYDNIGKYFPNLEIVGWFLSRLGFSTELNEKIVRTHRNYFPGLNKILYMIDSFESEDAFYLYDNDGLKKQKGYYIYYEKNEPMQTYMIDQKQSEKPKTKEKTRIIRKDEELIRNYRQVLARKQTEHPNSFFYVASTCLTIAILAVGITVVNNYDKMKLLEATVNEMAQSIDGVQEVSADVAKTTGSVLEDEDGQGGQGGSAKAADQAGAAKDKQEAEGADEEQSADKQQAADEEQSADKEQAADKEQSADRQQTADGKQIVNEQGGSGGQSQDGASQSKGKAEPQNSVQKNKNKSTKGNSATPAMSKGAVVKYTVKEGDTIISICKKLYGTTAYVNEIMNANGLTEGDPIYPKEKILVPADN